MRATGDVCRGDERHQLGIVDGPGNPQTMMLAWYFHERPLPPNGVRRSRSSQQFTHTMRGRREKRKPRQCAPQSAERHEDVVVAPRDVRVFMRQNRFEL